MTKTGKQEPQEASQGEVLTRRAAIKRIAAGLAGAGAFVVAGVICMEKPPYGDAVKLPYRDKAPN